jgi:hypothetical protein
MTNSMKSHARPILTSKQILVEGRSAEIFFREWIDSTHLKGQIEARDFGSISNLTGYLKLFISQKDFREKVTAIGIVRDAEEKAPIGAFDSVCASLTAAGVKSPDSVGVYSDGMPRAGVFILPDCESPGMLETLCWSAIQNDSDRIHHSKCVDSYLMSLREKNLIRNEAKARIWAYLAGFGEFEPQLGRSAQAKIWDWNNSVFSKLTSFMNSL